MSHEAEIDPKFRRVMLFLANREPNSVAALQNFQKLRDAAPNYEFEVQLVNVLDEYKVAQEHNVLVTPCLILIDPLPRVMIAGTLNDLEKVRKALHLQSEEGNSHGRT